MENGREGGRIKSERKEERKKEEARANEGEGKRFEVGAQFVLVHQELNSSHSS